MKAMFFRHISMIGAFICRSLKKLVIACIGSVKAIEDN